MQTLNEFQDTPARLHLWLALGFPLDPRVLDCNTALKAAASFSVRQHRQSVWQRRVRVRWRELDQGLGVGSGFPGPVPKPTAPRHEHGEKETRRGRESKLAVLRWGTLAEGGRTCGDGFCRGCVRARCVEAAAVVW